MPYRLRFQHRKKRAREIRHAKKASVDVYESKFPQHAEADVPEHNISSEMLSSASSFEQMESESSNSSFLSSSCDSQTIEPEAVQVKVTEIPALQSLHSSICLPSKAWSDQTPEKMNQIYLCKISQFKDGPLHLTHSLTVNADLTWSLFVNGREVLPSNCTAIGSFPSILDSAGLAQLVKKLDQLHICPGHPDKHFVSMVRAKKGKVMSPDGKVVCFVHTAPIEFNGQCYQETVCHTTCEVLSSSIKCSVCKNYRGTLRSMYHRWSKRLQVSSDSSSYTNERYLNTPEKKLKMSRLKNKARTALQAVVKLREKVCNLSRTNGELLDKTMETDLLAIMHENADKVRSTYAEGTFARLFWDEQLKVASLSDKRQIRWHPVIIKWCLNLKLLSSSAYHAMRSSGFITLPSERTLRDYSNYFKNNPGFQDEVDEQLLGEISKNLSDARRYVAILVDEMKVKEGLVFNKHSGEVIGFTNLGDISDELLRLEKEGEQPIIAKQILVLMVRGLMFKLNFPYAHFGTRGVTADVLFPIIWEAIHRLETRGVKVLCVTADGASPNRKFFRMHYHKKDSSTYLYKTRNVYSPDNRWLYFVSDPPHLIKTIRNCWSHSGTNGTRHMKIHGQFIEWRQLWDLFGKVSSMRAESLGLSLLPKLKREHLELSSFSRMRVDLAAQVLSKSVSDAFAYFNDPLTSETQKFVLTMDRFFDCLNVRNLDEWYKKRKEDRKPYYSPDDSRLTWLEKDFLKYLHDWESEAVASNPDNPTKMMLSRETLDGIKITGN